MSNEVVNKVASSVATNYGSLTGNKEAALDPATILGFADLIMKVIDMLKQCRSTPTAAAQTIKAPGLFARMRLRNLVRDSMSHKDFQSHGASVVEALLKTGTQTTPEVVSSLYKAS